MTAGHRDGGEQLAHDIDGGQDEDGVQEALQVAADAGGLDLVVRNQHEDHQRPGQLCHQVRRGTPDTQQADQVGDDAGDEDGAHQRNVAVKFRPHIAPDEVHQGGVDHFRHGLLPGDAGDFQPVAQPDAQGGDNGQDQPADHQGLRNGNFPEYGDVFESGENSRAVN